jgi:hypothetical protein
MNLKSILTQLKSPVGILFSIILLWHLQIAFFSNKKLAGFFMATPAKPGYVWADAKNTEARWFWSTTETSWKEGMLHPEFKIVSGKIENLWNPAPGYVFIDETKSQATQWKPGIKHPNFMAFADDAEGKFIPATGYKFVYNTDSEEFADCVWNPNQRYDDKKVISLEEKDTFQAYPGYEFVNPEKGIEVAWSPGLVNADNPKLVAGQQEGTWIVNVKPQIRYRNSSRGDELGREFARRVFWHVF